MTDHPGPAQDPRVADDDRHHDEAEPDRPHDHAAGRRERDPGAVRRRHRVHQRRHHQRRRRRVHHGLVRSARDGPGHRRRVGQRRPRASRPTACPRPARPSSAAGSPSTTAARAATRRSRRRGSVRTTWFVGAVGDDAFGAQARAALEAEGVDRRRLLTLPDEATGVALILVDARRREQHRGRRAARTPRCPRSHVRAALERSGPGPGDVVLVGHEIPTAPRTRRPRLGRAAGATTILNPAPADRPAIADPGPGRHRDPERRASWPSWPEASAGRCGRPGRRSGREAERVRPRQRRCSRRTILDAATAPWRSRRLVVEAVDTVGAGDTLNGALAAGLAAGLTWRRRPTRGRGRPSLAVTRAGAREGMPTAAELEAALAR